MVYEKRHPQEWTLSYEVVEGSSPLRKSFKSSWEEPDGTVFKVMGRYASLDLADKRKRELEEANMAWGVLEVETEEGIRGLRVEHVSRDFPKGKRIRRPDGLYRLEKTCRTEEEALAAREKLIAKAEKKGRPLAALESKDRKRRRGNPDDAPDRGYEEPLEGVPEGEESVPAGEK